MKKLLVQKTKADNTRYEMPPLKWAGGKRRVLDHILPVLPPGKRYIEPFVGSGIVFLNVSYPVTLLSDNNPDLIGFYRTVRDDTDAFIAESAVLYAPENNCVDVFMALRKEYNATRDPFRRASLFFYLNRHCFNGLYRVNSKGLYNVPFGRNPPFLGREVTLRNFARRLAAVELRHGDFQGPLSEAGEGDVVYCDPAYVPLTATANFSAYTSENFTLADQERLARCAEEASARGATVVVSNHDTELSRRLYQNAEIQAFGVLRAISQHVETRTKAPELLAIYRPWGGGSRRPPSNGKATSSRQASTANAIP